MNFVINGIRYHVEIWGNPIGRPLLLLHGFTGNGASWREFETQWQDYSYLISVDIIGHGKTDSPKELHKYEIESAASDLYTLLEEMKIEQTDLLGYSMGGRLALTFALLYPEKVRKLILESSSPGLETDMEREARRLQDEKLANRIQVQGIEEFVDYWENIPLFESQKRLPEMIRRKLRMERLMNSTVGLMNSLKGMGTGSQPSWWGKLEKLTAPVLFITGSIDEKFCRIAERMQKEVKNGEWITVDDCGHAIHVEKPKIFGTIVREFLSHEIGKKISSTYHE
ncbi:2-succinyl-6-hydroxy-2,4-cyclohexadiene-1-carboxylate synthase [Cytobacillus dafuensis]|uniref:Putative 2-succinyl-6-hydroxy-2,4-cyclohexadiene-1-carboxylate synthase n=1 Tax=Cytobacillus dafuensis TaxID=1742359 RepID=A0A5B8Z7X5_CYTDA|nr:2-succinyl-6-hydroxy-2,4-cyclohexadiene-1-carboxylate synthase [Cytobacillus dafuensis]QED49064.1 2-succinyl-6-hydroxy-2,4-cyclohexadiene-1-carboxylate synthase [Cytobacillus dafuensis]